MLFSCRFAGAFPTAFLHSEPEKRIGRLRAGKEKTVEGEKYAGTGLRELYEHIMPLVYRTAYSCLRNHHDAADVVQESFVRLAMSGKTFADEQQVKAWLNVTAANLAKDLLRRRSRRELPLEEASETAAPEEQGTLLPLVLGLPDRYRKAVYLHYYGGYGVRELAAMLQKPENTVKTWLRRGRELLRCRLGETG